MDEEIVSRVKQLQSSMIESATSRLDKSDLPHLRCLIRLTVEFHDYLRRGSTDLAKRLATGPFAKYTPDANAASEDPFNKYDMEYACDSISSGMESFSTVAASYRILEDAVSTKIRWDMISSRESFDQQFLSMYEAFTEEENFEKKCRLLLDLFKLQIVFAGMYYAS